MRFVNLLVLLIILGLSAFIGFAALSETRQQCPDGADCADARKMAWFMLTSAALCTLALLVMLFGKRRKS